ncbi:uncharacterized protein [Ptychodera flava]|uniref:uncharacterized protein n=1 Tax=Ptychodera flava TaxID=63121 RepID=UPI003969E7ED
MTSSLLTFLLALLSICSSSLSLCPDQCNCQDGVLSCHTESGEKLKTIPTNLYMNELSMITEINFEGNDIDQLNVGDFTGLGNVKVLNLKRNKLKVLLQGHFNGLRHVRQLWLAENSIRFLDTYVFSGLSHLREVDLSRNQIEYIPKGTFKTAGSDLHSPIETLELMNNNLNVLTAGMFEGLTKLKSLYLDYNDIESIETNAFSPLVDLKILSLRNVNLKPNVFIFALQRLYTLRQVYLSGNLFPCNCDWLDMKYELESRGAQINDLSDTPTCEDEQTLLCQKLRENPESREKLGYKFITLREVKVPKVDRGKIIVDGKKYDPTSIEGEEAILEYDTEMRERIQQLPDENKRNFFLRIFQSRMEEFIQKYVLSVEKEENLGYPALALNADANSKRYRAHQARLEHIDAKRQLKGHSLHLAQGAKIIAAMVTPGIIILCFFCLLCYCRGRAVTPNPGEELGTKIDTPICFKPCVQCYEKLIQRKEYALSREKKLQERLEFKKLHGQVKESIDRPKNIFARKAAEEGSDAVTASKEDDFQATLQKQRKMSLGGTRFSSSDDDEEEEEVVFDRSKK